MSVSVSSSESFHKSTPTPVSDGLIHEFLFDGNLDDNCGNIVTIDPDGKGLTGTGWTFNYASPVGSYGSIPKNAATSAIFRFTSTNTFSQSNPVSVSLWLQVPSDSTNQNAYNVMAINRYANNWGIILNYYPTNISGYAHNSFRAHISDNAGNVINAQWKAGMDNNWHHFVVTYSGSNTFKVYIDNVLFGTGTAASTGTADNKVVLGNTYYNPANLGTVGYFNYALLRIFSKELSANEVSLLYNEVA